MLISRNRISLNHEEVYYTLHTPDAFCVTQGSVGVYIVMHTQESRLERRVCVCRVSAGDNLVIPSFSHTANDDEVWCFAIVASVECAELTRKAFEEKQREFFIGTLGIQGYKHENFEDYLMQYYENYIPEEERPEAILVNAEAPFIADEPEIAYYVESGAAYVYLMPVTGSGMLERKEYLCRASLGDDFVIPGMLYESNDRIWRINIAAEDGTVKLQRIQCTRVAREKFIDAIEQQSAAGMSLMEIYKHEGFEETLVQYYARKNDLADTIRAERQFLHRADVRENLDNAIKRGVHGQAAARIDAEGNAALYQTLKYLCQKGNIFLMEEDELSRRCTKMLPQEIARVSGFICREVVLEPDWFRHDCGLLLATLDSRLVACIPKGGSGYYLYDSTVGKEVKLSAKTAQQIHPQACSIRRGLPAKSLKYRDVLRYVMKGIRSSDVFFTALLGVLCVLVGILLPYLNQKIYDDYVPMGDTNMLVQMCLVIGTFMLGNIFFTLVKKLHEFRVASRAGYDLQDAMYARVFELPESFLNKYESGDIAQRVQAFGSLANQIVTKVVVTGISSVLALLYLFQMVHYAKKLVLGAIVMIVAYGLIVYFVSIFAVRYEKTIAEKDNESAAKLHQLLSGIQKIRMAGVEERAILEYIKPVAEQQQATIRSNHIAGMNDVLRDAGVTIFSMVFYFLLVHNKMELSTGNFIAFNTAFGSFASAMLELVNELIEYRFLKPRMNLIKPLLENAPETDAEKNLDNVDHLDGHISFEHVTFSYSSDGAPVLRDLSFDIKPGEYVGLVGRSGCGKSTILKLLLGFQTPQAGRILYDGRDLSTLDKRSLRKRLGVVLQNGSLISGSIYDNIVITSENPSRSAAELAVEKVGLKQDIAEMPMHLDTVINESAGTISGGQKQRILIARAIASNPNVLLFDEATSALDNITQAKVCESLDQMNVTRIVIAHRLSTIENCDRILVLDKGVIVEEGNFEQLFAKRGLFYEMAKRQIAGIEESE